MCKTTGSEPDFPQIPSGTRTFGLPKHDPGPPNGTSRMQNMPVDLKMEPVVSKTTPVDSKTTPMVYKTAYVLTKTTYAIRKALFYLQNNLVGSKNVFGSQTNGVGVFGASFVRAYVSFSCAITI